MHWFKHANTRQHVSEQRWLCGWIILDILAHLAHLARFYFSLIFSAINTHNCFWFDLINKKNSMTEDKIKVKSDQCLRLFSSRRQPPLLVHIGFQLRYLKNVRKVKHSKINHQELTNFWLFWNYLQVEVRKRNKWCFFTGTETRFNFEG